MKTTSRSAARTSTTQPKTDATESQASFSLSRCSGWIFKILMRSPIEIGDRIEMLGFKCLSPFVRLWIIKKTPKRTAFLISGHKY